jgi:hypothetical protein
VLTQDEWNEKQRSERKSEFSWNYNGNGKSKNNSTDSDIQNIEEEENDDDMVGPSLDMFLTPNNPNKQSTIIPKKQPIHNELDDEPLITKKKPLIDDSDLDSIPLPSEPKKGAEIAPPPTYEYYGPNSRRQKVQDNIISINEMQDSINIGFQNANIRNKLQ